MSAASRPTWLRPSASGRARDRRGFFSRLRRWTGAAAIDPLAAAAIEREIENHILERAERLIAEGMLPQQAYREAKRRFGDVRRVRRTLERIESSTKGPMRRNELFGSVLRDLRQGLRLLRTAPGFAVAMVLTIGLGVGANTAVFSITDAVLLRPLPFAQPEDLVAIDRYDPTAEATRQAMRNNEALTWEREAPELAGLILYGLLGVVRTDATEPVNVAAHAVSPDWLRTLGVQPRLGRSFSAEEGLPGGPTATVVSDGFWRSQLGGDTAALGRTIELDERPVTVVGVMGPDFKFPPLGPTDLWVPLAGDGTVLGRAPSALSMVGRLPEELGIEAARERFAAIGAGLEEVDPQERGWQVRLAPFDSFRANRDVERALWVLTGGVGIMLLIATINAANLLLLRAVGRRAETEVRMALGASRLRLVRQHITESLALVMAGGVVAVLFAELALRSIIGLLPSELTFFLTSRIAINLRVLGFAFAATVITGLALSLIPALRATGAVQRAAVSRASASPRAAWVRNGLVVAEVAMTVTLLVVAGLLIKSFLRLTAVDTGYQPERMIQLTVSLPAARYADGAARVTFFHRLKDSLAAIPGVAAVSLADGVPPAAAITFGIEPQAEGQEPKELPELFIARVWVEPSFFEAIGTPIASGRGFTAEDRADDSVVIDRDMARFLWGEENPVGRRFRLDGDEPWLTVVGTVGNMKLMGKDDRQGTLDMFEPLPRDNLRGYMSVVMRSAVAPASLMPQVRAVVHELDPGLPISRLATGDERLAEELDKPRFFLLMMGNLAAIALALAVVGTYGVLAFAVRQRHRELGVRIALGADAGRLVSLVLRQGVALAATGVLLGLAGAFALGGVARSLLFELEPTDPATFAGVAAVMLVCSGLACWAPARRATRVDPVRVLRAE